MKYTISKYIKLEKVSNDNEDIFILRKFIRKERIYIINEMIYTFLKYFELSNTFRNVVLEFESLIENKSNYTEVETILFPFFKRLLKLDMLIPNDRIEEEIDFSTFFKIGDKIDDFLVKDIISDAKYFDIYLVEKNNKKYAIKYLNKKKFFEQEKYKEYVKVLRHEYEILKKINHQNICKVYYLNSNYKEFYLVMEYYNGIPINTYYNENKLNKNQKKELLISFINAMAYLHAKGIYHGDLHFGNVIVTKEQNLIVLDFGLAGSQIERKENDFIETIKVGGVHYFMPPERISYLNGKKRGKYKKIASFSSEVYQLGLISYFILIEKLPFKSTTINTLFEEKVKYNPMYDDNCRFIEENLKGLILKSLAKNEKDRFRSAAEMVNFKILNNE